MWLFVFIVFYYEGGFSFEERILGYLGYRSVCILEGGSVGF